MFDATWTLIYPRPRFTRVYVEAGQRHGVSLTEEEVRSRFNRHFVNVTWDNTDETAQLLIWKSIIASIFAELDSTDGLFDELWSYYSQPSAWEIYDDVLPAWQKLTDLGVRIIVGSNFDRRLQAICGGHDVFQNCDRIFWSADMRLSKPQLEFYRSIEEQLQLHPHQLLMVGDDWQNDYVAPRTAGWSSIWLNRNAVVPPENECDMITSLVELLSALGNCCSKSSRRFLVSRRSVPWQIVANMATFSQGSPQSRFVLWPGSTIRNICSRSRFENERHQRPM